MSIQSDKLITEVARNEHKQLRDSVVVAAKYWRGFSDGRRSPNATRNAIQNLEGAVDVLINFEERHKERLNG